MYLIPLPSLFVCGLISNSDVGIQWLFRNLYFKCMTFISITKWTSSILKGSRLVWVLQIGRHNKFCMHRYKYRSDISFRDSFMKKKLGSAHSGKNKAEF